MEFSAVFWAFYGAYCFAPFVLFVFFSENLKYSGAITFLDELSELREY